MMINIDDEKYLCIVRSYTLSLRCRKLIFNKGPKNHVNMFLDEEIISPSKHDVFLDIFLGTNRVEVF